MFLKRNCTHQAHDSRELLAGPGCSEKNNDYLAESLDNRIGSVSREVCEGK